MVSNQKETEQSSISADEMANIEKMMKEAQLKEEEKANVDVSVEFTQLKEDYAKSLEEVEKLKEQLVRNIADTENLRKRTAKQIEDAAKFSINKFSQDLIDVLENLYLATNNISPEILEANSAFAAVFQGVDMTKKTLINVFDKYGIKRITPNLGDQFDHNLHEAVSHIEKDDCEPNTIVDVMRSGYTLNDRLLRPAMVVVAKITQ